MVTERAPQFIPQAEALLGTKAFYDSEREDALHATGKDRLTFTAESAGMRGILYVRALRLIAEARAAAEHPMRALRPSQLGRFALEHLPEVLEIARQLAVINTAERTLAEQEESFLGGLRSVQQPYMHDIVAFLNTAAQEIEYTSPDGELRRRYLQGALVEAPTGIGKTVLMARALVATGVGKPIENIEHDQGRVRALIIVPSQTIVEQMSGKVGDDTLRRFAPGIDIGAYYQFEKDREADAVVITIDQFVDNFRNGKLFNERFDVCIIDEAHTVTQPQLLQVLTEHWHGGPIMGFTATPEYNEVKDARNILRHRIHHGDLLDFIESEEDVLNAAQLFEIRVDHNRYLDQQLMDSYEGMREKDIDQMVIREATAEYLLPQIEEGRRGIIFCEQGGGEASGYALKMASRLSQLMKPDGTPLRCAVAVTINAGKSPHDPDSNAGIRRRYRQGELDFIVTVDWGREGLNEDIDTVITAGKITSRLKFLQEIGRGTRLSKRFPITTYAHIFVPTKDAKSLSLFSLFGFEEIEQGVVIGHKNPKKTAKDSSKKGTPATSSPGALQTHHFPLRIQELLETVQAKTVGEALFHDKYYLSVPKEYKPFEDINKDVPGPPTTIRRHLRDEMGFKTIGRYRMTEIGRKFVFYFEPAAEKYLGPFRGAVARVDLQRELGAMARVDLQRESGVDASIVDALAKETKVTSFPWFYYDGRRIPHFSKTDAEIIRHKFNETPPAAPTDYNRPKLAAAAGVSESVLMARLLPAEKALKTPKRTLTAQGMIRVLDHWTKEQGDKIVDRLKELAEADGVPVYLVPQELAVRHVAAQKDVLADFADGIGHPTELVRIARGGRPPRCLTWVALQAAEAEFGIRHRSFTIDYTSLPHDRKDKDRQRRDYAQSILEKMASLPAKKFSK